MHLKWSKGSPQAVHAKWALQAVEPKGLTRRVSRLPQRGQDTAVEVPVRNLRSAVVPSGGAIPWMRIFSRASGPMRSVLQIGFPTQTTETAEPQVETADFTLSRMTSEAGHPK